MESVNRNRKEHRAWSMAEGSKERKEEMKLNGQLFQGHNFQLFIQFTKREFLTRYKQSFMGIGWAIMQPLFMMAIFSVIFGGFAKIPSDNIPYPIFSYTALLPWAFLSTSINTGVNSLVSNTSLITKVYFSRELLPFASITTAVLDFMIAAIIFCGMLLWYRIDLTIYTFLFAPLFILQVSMVAAVVLILSIWNVRYRDVRHGLPLIIQCWMYASPVVYPLSLVPEKWRTLYLMNPMAGLINSYRLIFLQGQPPRVTEILPAFIFALIGLPLSYLYFKKAEKSFADII
ncbi:MAG: ABC transporter permease [Candidatus Scalindua sp.]